MKFLILSILAGLGCQASARIGESPEQLAARYGKAEVGKTTAEPYELIYQKSGIYITAVIWKNACHSISFQGTPPLQDPFTGGFVLPGDEKPVKPEASDPAKPVSAGPLSDAQMLAILEANGGGSKWNETKKGSWSTADDMLHAYTVETTLKIYTLDFLKFLSDERKKPDKTGLEGF